MGLRLCGGKICNKTLCCIVANSAVEFIVRFVAVRVIEVLPCGGS